MEQAEETIRAWVEAREWARLQLEDLESGTVRVVVDGEDVTGLEALRLARAIDGLSQLIDLASRARREAEGRRPGGATRR